MKKITKLLVLLLLITVANAANAQTMFERAKVDKESIDPSVNVINAVKGSLNYGRRMTGANESERDELKMMATYFPEDQAKEMFNTNLMIMSPCNLRGEVYKNKFTPIDENELSQHLSGTEPMVTIHVSRMLFGETFTISSYQTTQNDNGSILSFGYFIEPEYNESMAGVGGSNTAIPKGTYTLVPGVYSGKEGTSYYLSGDDLDGRSEILIHTGNKGSHTSGCLLPGESYSKIKGTSDYEFIKSKYVLDQLHSIINQYGYKNVNIIIE